MYALPSPLISFSLFHMWQQSMTVQNREIDTGFVGDGVGAVRDSEFAVRQEDAERDAQGGACCVPQDRWAQSDPDWYQVRWRRVEPHIRQSRHQVRGDHLLFLSIETFLIIIIIAWMCL